jgi:DNA invertase Pin-like site-specific DNA recombinase
VLFIATLLESKVDFICCDMPTANRITIHIMAALAEEEARLISQRTKEALAVARAKGKKLGGARTRRVVPTAEERSLRLADRLESSYGSVLPTVKTLKSQGMSHEAIARVLNSAGFRTPKGKAFRQSTICNILQRIDAAAV